MVLSDIIKSGDMMNKNFIIIPAIILITMILGIFIYKKSFNKNSIQNVNSSPSTQEHLTVIPSQSVSVSSSVAVSVTPTQSPVLSNFGLVYPIAEFKERITKKPFGIYITPQNSPVQPERFSGYHNGVDVEYQDVESDVPVYAVNSGKVVYSGEVSGYGGVVMLEIELDGAKHTVLYGHIRPSSLPSLWSSVNKGDQIGLLGTGYSSETDGERRHLHFAILSDNRIDVRGYVQSESELSSWLNPLNYYN